jgi:stress-induced morphogen
MTETQRSVRESLERSFPKSPLIQVDDISGGCGSSFSVMIVSELFEGVAPLDRSRLVHTGLGDLMKSIHALTIKTMTVKAYDAKKAKGEL